jgi:tubulin-specific chaperone D
MEEDLPETTLLASFTKYEEFSSTQKAFLDACNSDRGYDASSNNRQLNKLTSIVRNMLQFSTILLLTCCDPKLAEYQEQSYLLDPYLERLVNPVVEQLKKLITETTLSSERIGLIAKLLHIYINFRGYKSISMSDLNH